MNNFTPLAQQVLALARKEADRLHHNFVGTEHLLLGVIKLGQGVAVSVLQKLGVDLETVRTEVEKKVGAGPDQELVGNIPYTPRVKKVLALAAKEARTFNHTYVGTEHILLGLLRETDGLAARILVNLGVDIEKTRLEISKELDPKFDAETCRPRAGSVLAKQEVPIQMLESPKPIPDKIDTTKRYDVYCASANQQITVYSNALFKGTKKLLPGAQYAFLCEFVELEQSDGQTVFLARSSILKFSEHRA